MNTYVIIARHLGKVSGEKIYTNNKMRFMLSQGWRVVFLSSKKEETLCDGLPDYSHYVFPALAYTPVCFSKREIKKTVDKILSVIGDLSADQCIIESDAVNRAVWGELIAQKAGARHLAFLLQETHNYDKATIEFLRFKYDRHELSGIATQSINQILNDASVEQRDDTKITAYCINVVEDCEDVYSDQLIKNAKYTFGSLGRLDKGCVPRIIEGFKTYAASHPTYEFNVVLIGGATGQKRIKQLKNEVRNCENIHLYITGYLYPVPLSLIKNVDLFVSTAGSTAVTYRFQRPTIKVHPVTGEPVGIMGLDNLDNKTMYDIMPNSSIAECIDRALTNTDKIQYNSNYDDYYLKMNAEFARQLSFAGIVKQKEYYPEEKLIKLESSRIIGKKWHRIIGHLAGPRALNWIISMSKKILNR